MSQMEMLEAARREHQEDEVLADVLKILEPGNEFLQEVVDQFGKTRMQANKAQVACFYELKVSNVGKIVGREDRTVGSRKGVCVLHRLTGCAEICGKRKLWLPRPIRFDEQVLSLADPFQHEQIWEAYGGRLRDGEGCHSEHDRNGS